jgi:beta-1,4-mannosyl-glycoprotein beta-1,4-N-acetylglucosaminyltransferase
MSDVDEIPSRSALSLLRACESPLPIHLQMQNFLYSYEFTTDHHSWRAQMHRWDDNGRGGTDYVHGKASDIALSDAGWHCR